MILNRKIMKWVAVTACSVAWALPVHAGESPVLPPAVMAPPPQPTKMPEFDFANLHGGTLKSSELKGKVIVIRFWATW